MTGFLQWLHDRLKWQPPQDEVLLTAIHATFDNHYGRITLKYLLDNYYCQVRETTDPIELATHNGQRVVVEDLLRKLDQAQHPDKYRVEVTQQSEAA